MDLARIAVKLRPRNPWEGIDLGFMLAREWLLPLWLLWMMSAVPVMLLLAVLPIPYWLVVLLFWWFKPLYEPPLLYWLSRRLFGERLSWRELREAWPRAVLPHLLANLTWRRLHPSRSFLMPVSVLEHLKGKQRSQRIRVLSRRSNAASWLTVVGAHFEFALYTGFIFLLILLVPDELLWFDVQEFLNRPNVFSLWIQQIGYLLAISMVAPFYVAGGFALYLTRRSELEGWDMELGLRRMARRCSTSVASWVGALLLGGLAVWAIPATPLQAGEFERQVVRSHIEEVLTDEAFGKDQEVINWEYVGDKSNDEVDRDNPFLEWLLSSSESFATFGEFLLWLGGGALLAYLIYWFLTHRELQRGGLGRSRNGQAVPSHVAGLDLRPDSLPEDPAAEAERLIEAGDYRGALSLLYRGALSSLVHQHALDIPVGATEGECRRLVAIQLGQDLHGCFSGLTSVWLNQAYGHWPPGRDQALRLCREWRSCFGGADVGG